MCPDIRVFCLYLLLELFLLVGQISTFLRKGKKIGISLLKINASLKYFIQARFYWFIYRFRFKTITRRFKAPHPISCVAYREAIVAPSAMRVYVTGPPRYYSGLLRYLDLFLRPFAELGGLLRNASPRLKRRPGC